MTSDDHHLVSRPVDVLIVEDSATIRRFLEILVNRDPRLRTMASVESAEEGLRLLEKTSPAVISLDIRLPGMNGFEFTKRVMANKPIPIVVCSASVESDELRITMNALAAGALSVVEKPVGATHQDYSALADRLCTQLALMSQVKVLRQWNPRVGTQVYNSLPPIFLTRPPEAGLPHPTMIGIAASTGGPNALATLLGSLPRDFPVPILVVQHITSSFSDGFIEWLGTVCPLPVVKAASHQIPKTGHVYVAPADQHLTVRGVALHVEPGAPVCMQCPSGTTLLHSMAGAMGRRALGVVLTGMGEDGAEGLLAVRTAGGYTIAEHRSTAVVYGMPGAAERRGAARELLPLEAIGPRLCQLVAAREENTNEESSKNPVGRGFTHAGYATS